MPGTKEGAAKRRETMIKKAGSQEAYLKLQRDQAAKGGKNANPNHPANFRNNRKLASRAGSIKRTQRDQPRRFKQRQYKDELALRDSDFKLGREINNEIKRTERRVLKDATSEEE